MSPEAFHDLLIQYQKYNEQEILRIAKMIGFEAGVKRPKVCPPNSAIPTKVPTLQLGHYRKITPFLKVRFEYASEWQKAYAGHDWLSLDQMETAPKDPLIQRLVKERAEIWTASPPAMFALDRISLFGVYRDQAEEIYLVWPEVNDQEPKVVSYAGNDESRFDDLGEFVLYCSGKKEK